MIGHERARDLLAVEVDFPLTDAERTELAEHRFGCDACRRYEQLLRRDAKQLADLPDPVPPERAWASIESALLAGRRPMSRAMLVLVAALLLAALAGATLAVGALLNPVGPVGEPWLRDATGFLPESKQVDIWIPDALDRICVRVETDVDQPGLLPPLPGRSDVTVGRIEECSEPGAVRFWSVVEADPALWSVVAVSRSRDLGKVRLWSPRGQGPIGEDTPWEEGLLIKTWVPGELKRIAVFLDNGELWLDTELGGRPPLPRPAP